MELEEKIAGPSLGEWLTDEDRLRIIVAKLAAGEVRTLLKAITHPERSIPIILEFIKTHKPLTRSYLKMVVRHSPKKKVLKLTPKEAPPMKVSAEDETKDIPTDETKDIPTDETKDIPTDETKDIPTDETKVIPISGVMIPVHNPLIDGSPKDDAVEFLEPEILGKLRRETTVLG